MLPQEFRLRRKRDFDILFAEGRFVPGELLNLMVWEINPVKYPKRGYQRDDLKIGFVVGLKVSKSAVARNRLRRQMREVVRLLWKEQRLKKGIMMAFVAKRDILGKSYKEIEQSIFTVLRKAERFSQI